MLKQAVLFTLVAVQCAIAQAPGIPALEGFDPVLLTEGQEVPGKQSIALQQGRFLYQFSSAETRDRFRKEPDRYSIQLDGACARMGPPVGGSADAYFVFDHRIYIFGSRECYKRFSAEPGKYLESAHPKPVWDPTAETRAQGKAQLDRLIDALGGAAKWGRIQSYAETRRTPGPAGDLTIRIAARLPDSIITETTAGGNTFGNLVTPSGAWGLFGSAPRELPESFGRAVLADARRDLLPLLLDRHADGFEVYYAGRSGAADLLQINDRGRISTLVMDPASVRVKAIAWRGHSPDGIVTFRTSYSDYRTAGGLQLPYRADGSIEEAGAQVPANRSWTVESYELNPADIETRLRPPAKVQE